MSLQRGSPLAPTPFSGSVSFALLVCLLPPEPKLRGGAWPSFLSCYTGAHAEAHQGEGLTRGNAFLLSQKPAPQALELTRSAPVHQPLGRRQPQDHRETERGQRGVCSAFRDRRVTHPHKRSKPIS